MTRKIRRCHQLKETQEFFGDLPTQEFLNVGGHSGDGGGCVVGDPDVCWRSMLCGHDFMFDGVDILGGEDLAVPLQDWSRLGKVPEFSSGAPQEIIKGLAPLQLA